MQVLAAGGRAAILPLLPPPSEAGHLAMVHAVIDGAMPGHVLVDDATRPRSAIVLNDCGFHAALGRAPAEPVAPLVALVRQRFVSAEPGLLIDVSGDWAAALRPVLPPSYLRNEYHAPAALPAPRPLPPGFACVPITPAIAARFEGAVDPWVVRIWGGPDAFAKHAFGWAVVSDAGALASFCASLAIGGGEVEVEIGTGDRFKRQGLAYAAGRALMASAGARGLRPAWTCRADNAPSNRLALALGYARFRAVACFPFDRLSP